VGYPAGYFAVKILIVVPCFFRRRIGNGVALGKTARRMSSREKLSQLFGLRLLAELLQVLDRVENIRNVSLADKLHQISGVDSDLLEELFFRHAVTIAKFLGRDKNGPPDLKSEI
jgi:hypothetical protein